jgi:hypothetical protein
MASVAFLVIAAAGCGGGEQAPDSPVEETVAVVDEQDVAEPTMMGHTEELAVPIGEPVTVGDAQWTVTDTEQLDELVSRLGSEEGNFIVTDVTFVNNSNQDVALGAPYLTLLDSEGREFEVDLESTFTHVEGSRNLFVTQIEPGATMEGLVIFSVDPDAAGFELRVGDATDFVSDKQGYIDLGF